MRDIFNNRELAVGIWTLLLIVWALKNSEIRKPFRGVISVFLNWKILTIFGLFIGYVLLCLHILYSLTIWDISQVKNTVIWSIFVGAVSLFGIAKIKKDDNYFSSSFKQQFKIIVFVEFLVAFHTFGLLIELILVLLSTLLVCVSAYAVYHHEHHKTKVIVDRVLAFLGISLLLYSLFVTISDADKFIQFSTFQDFTIPVFLSMMLFPFLYVLSKLIAYENAYIKVYIYTQISARRRYAIVTSLFAFKGNIEAIENWLRHSCIPEFETNEKIKKSIKNYKEKHLKQFG